jgi:outer membrane protein OmpA-like peptidoglycan-associated protein
MRIRLSLLGLVFSSFACSVYGQDQQPSADSLIYAEGKVINAATREPIAARITYQSLPYGNRIGVINNSSYSFPMFDNEKYTIIVEAQGFAQAKYMLDPAQANGEKKVIKDIELSNGTEAKPATHNVGHVMRLNNLIFEVGNAKIDPESYPELDILVNMMQENPTMVIQLEGHTDYVGIASDNLKLSQRRVESVKSYMITKGVAKNRLKTKAFGGAQPLSRDNTPEAHRLNRRVEVRILQE